MELINQFGGKRDVIVLLLFVLGFILVNSGIKSKKIRLATSTLASIFISAQAFSLYSIQSFIGYQFYVHMNLRGVAGMQSLFIIQITILILFLIILIITNFYSYFFWRKLNHLIKSKKNLVFIRAVSLLVFAFLIILERGFVMDTRSLESIIATNDTIEFKDVLLKYNMSNYITPNEIECSAGKNIIIISMESIEQGFLNEKHSSITPNLNKLKSRWNYLNIKQNCGSGWTSGALYTYLTGFPAFFGAQGNSIFQKSYHSNISSISHVLEKANYQTTYLNGNTVHSGIDEILNVFQFDKIIDTKNTPKTGYESKYGLRDKDLFSQAKSEIDILKDSQEPFALFISTTDSHFPNGIYDERMESVITPKNSNLEFTVASLDYMIGDFISYLTEKDIFDNTVIYIFPDHLKMGDPTIFMNTGERELYLITNAKNEDVDIEPSNELYQIDLPKIILDGAKIEHNLKFLTDYIHGNKDRFIRENITTITKINRVGLSRFNTQKYIEPKVSQHYEEYKKDTLRYIAHAGGIIDGYTYTNSLEALEMSYSKGFRLFELDIRKTKDEKYVAVHDWEDWKNMTGYVGNTPVTHKEFIDYKIYKKFTPLGMEEINFWFKTHPDAILITDKINEPELFSKAFYYPKRLMMELFTKQAVEEGVKAGILSSIPNQHVINDLDWDLVMKLGIKHAAVSRFFISSNYKLLKKLKENDIKVYVYNINQDGDVTDSGMDEEYVTKYELDYVYGLYADKWNFE